MNVLSSLFLSTDGTALQDVERVCAGLPHRFRQGGDRPAEEGEHETQEDDSWRNNHRGKKFEVHRYRCGRN